MRCRRVCLKLGSEVVDLAIAHPETFPLEKVLEMKKETGLVPFKEFFLALKEIGYENPMVIESFDPSFEETAGNCAIWRTFAPSGEAHAIDGLKNLEAIAEEIGE